MIALLLSLACAPEDPAPAWRVLTYPVPDGVVLEVGGLAVLPDQSVLAATRRGEIWRITNAFTDDPAEARFSLWADGLQEPLGLTLADGWVYCAERTEICRMRDSDGDGRMDQLETVADSWRVSGNYHEYAFGPRIDARGDLWITTNKPFGDEPFGRVDWRGFALRFTPDGQMHPMACGLRSPSGIEIAPWGEVFYTDNQGEWCGASKLSQIRPGSFHGHPWGLFSCDRPEWPYERPADPPDGMLMPLVKERIKSFELPAVWFPYDEMGRSPTGFQWDQSGGAFGPFSGQVFVGDQYAASILRVSLEQVNGHWQGACYPFLSGLQSGVIRLRFAPDGSLLAGMSDRGWPSLGTDPFGLQRVVFDGPTPFELLQMRAAADGFELEFTRPLDREIASDPSTWSIESYTYELHAAYGSDEMDRAQLELLAATVSPDARSVHLSLAPLRRGYVHELRFPGLRGPDGSAPRHARAYYTLIEIPE